MLAVSCVVLAFSVHSVAAAELAKALAILFFFIAIKYMNRAGLTEY